MFKIGESFYNFLSYSLSRAGLNRFFMQNRYLGTLDKYMDIKIKNILYLKIFYFIIFLCIFVLWNQIICENKIYQADDQYSIEYLKIF